MGEERDRWNSTTMRSASKEPDASRFPRGGWLVIAAAGLLMLLFFGFLAAIAPLTCDIGDTGDCNATGAIALAVIGAAMLVGGIIGYVSRRRSDGPGRARR